MLSIPQRWGGSDKVDTDEADEVIVAIAKTVAELTCRKDGVIRQQLIEQLMREIMNYDGEFRRECWFSWVGFDLTGGMSDEPSGAKDGDAATTVAKLVETLGQPTGLRDVGVRPEHYDAIAAGAMQNVFVRSNPRPITEPAQIREILEMAW